jgi:glycosyltransferase involved in cell wall biosynthesis
MGERPVILILSSRFAPAFKAGGPIQSLHALVNRLSGEFRFKVLTRDRDTGETRPFPGIPAGAWRAVDGAEVLYMPPGPARGLRLIREIRAAPHRLLYINSFFDPLFTLLPLLALKAGLLKHGPVVLAPRGELAAGALAQKRFKKWFFLRVLRGLGLYRDVVWHATCEEERQEILEAFPGLSAGRIVVARNLAMEPPAAPAAPARPPKRAGVLRAVFVSRISPKKNLGRAIALLARVKGRVSLDVFGNLSDPAYWHQCLDEAARHPELTVVYQGAIPHETVVARLRDYDVFLFPTLGENFGHVILESLLAGCPVCVSTATPWQTLEAEGAGWVIPLEREEAFVRVLQEAADMDEPAHAKRRESAVRVGREALHDRRPVEDNLRLFQEALRPPKPGDPHAG